MFVANKNVVCGFVVFGNASAQIIAVTKQELCPIVILNCGFFKPTGRFLVVPINFIVKIFSKTLQIIRVVILGLMKSLPKLLSHTRIDFLVVVKVQANWKNDIH